MKPPSSSEGQSSTTPAFSVKSCPADSPLSCSLGDDPNVDTCCYETPGGVLLSTQFWDYDPPVGPKDAFTFHGLWPDLCDGSYKQYCDDSITVDSVESVLKDFGETALLDKMNTIWKDYKGNDDDLWTHEYNKHGTCMSTIKPSCYDESNYKEHQNMVDYIKKATELYDGLPTYKWLAAKGIVPSETNTYTKQQIMDAISANFGHTAYISCDKNNGLQEVWYFHHLKGNLLTGEYVPMEPLANSTKCPESGIYLFPKTGSTSTSSSAAASATPSSDSGAQTGYLKPQGQDGCLISNGHWYTTGTCATYTLSEASFGGYQLKSSKGDCAVTDAGFTCGSSVTAGQFDYDSTTQEITYGGVSDWSADEVPSGSNQETVKSGTGSISFKLTFSAN
ncbi:unnamed protein product [Ambrosiozyma monospora]|uniref:ribonuclease T2 n=1 Tax=Ambrosiozyma monospora TaxID=43982 RepID=A0A9W7DJU2_AMBMO|nr:unnamed protein product [Ambrosiozyma monospora]